MPGSTSVEIQLSDGLVAGGEVWLPDGDGPHPAIVTLQGSGDADRSNNGYFTPIQNYFVSQGFAVLLYDKPGTGESTGNWRHRHLQDRAREAIEAVQFLRQHPEIDPSRIGLFGHSQGGWVVQIAAATSSDIAFVICQSGPGIPPDEQTVHDVEHSMRKDGYSEAEIEHGIAYIHALMDAARRNLDYDIVEREILADARGKPWTNYISVDDADVWTFFQLSTQNDPHPREVLPQIQCPMLAIFGELDVLVPVEQSVDTFEAAREKSGNNELLIGVFKNANHRLLDEDSGAFSDGYFELLSEWLGDRAAQE